MYITTLEIEGLRCFDKSKIELSPSINILTGANNSGKSTIIKSIFTFQDDYALKKSDIRVDFTGYIILLKLKFRQGFTKFNFFKISNTVFKSDDVSLFTELTMNTNERKILIDLPLYNEDESLWKIKLHDDKYDFSSFARSEQNGNWIYPFLAKRKATHYYSQKTKDDTFNVLDTLSNLPAKIKKASSHPRYKHEFKRLCLDILGFEIVGTIPADNQEDKIGIYAGNAYETITIESMGEGVANIVGLITILLTEDNKLYLIEELENDLHPAALKKLLNLIIEKSNKNQFIISTHSNIVLKYLGSLDTTKIFFTESLMNEEYIPTSTIEEIENTPQERIKVLEQLGYDLMDYELYKAYLILEESSAESIIKEFLIPKFLPQLHGKLRTIAANGVDDLEPKFNDFHRLFLYLHLEKAYNNKAWVIADGDKVGVDTINKLKVKFKSWDEKHFSTFKEEAFEKYYPTIFQEQVTKVLAMEHGKKKQNAKTGLLKKVLDWIKLDSEIAKAEFEISAKEVIEKLQSIASTIQN